MKLMIPTIGVVIELTRPWTFTLFQERRNHAFAKALGLEWQKYAYGREAQVEAVTLPVGSRLTVDRIYLRQQKTEYDSVTFRLNMHLTAAQRRKQGVLGGRFWVKLYDVNRIVGEIDHSTWPGMDTMQLLAMCASEDEATE